MIIPKPLPDQDFLKSILDYDENTGIFKWKIHKNGMKQDRIAGSLHPQGYINIGINKIYYLAHRLAWKYVYGNDPVVIDHINGNKSDNRISNLRDCSKRENCQNMELHREGKMPGVHQDTRINGSGRWIAKIWVGNDPRRIGTYDTYEEACTAYLRACEDPNEVITRKSKRAAQGIPKGIHYSKHKKKWVVNYINQDGVSTSYGRCLTLEDAIHKQIEFARMVQE